MKKILARSKTKGELTTVVAKNVKDYAEGGQVVVAWGTECEATHRDVTHFTKYTRRSRHEDYFRCSGCLCSSCYPTLNIFS